MLNLCCIDVGTNSVLHLLSQIDSKGRITPLQFHAETTRLGKSLMKNNTINKKAQHKTISVIKKYVSGTDKCIIAGTSALRDAKNRNEFVKLLYKETGQKIKILSEQEEAGLVFDSVKYFLKPIQKKVIICDIGGGSTEFIFCNNRKAVKKISIPFGAVNLMERFRNNISRMEYFIKSKIERQTGFRLICVGGTVTTLGAILQRLKRYRPDKVHKMTVSFAEVVSVLRKLNSLSLHERKKMICFDPKRADIIIAGICILKNIMETFDVKNFKICDRGLVYGLAVNYSKYMRRRLQT